MYICTLYSAIAYILLILVQKQQESIPLQAVISKRPSYTGMEGTHAYHVKQVFILASLYKFNWEFVQNNQAVKKCTVSKQKKNHRRCEIKGGCQ